MGGSPTHHVKLSFEASPVELVTNILSYVPANHSFIRRPDTH